MKNTNIAQAILYKQGKNALKGDVSGHTDAEVRRKGVSRLARWGGGLATGAVIAVLAVSTGLRKQEGVDAARAKGDAEAAAKLFKSDYGSSFSGAVSAAPEGDATTGGDAAATTPSAEAGSATLAAAPVAGGESTATTTTVASVDTAPSPTATASTSHTVLIEGGVTAEAPVAPTGGVGPK